jgi:hypothetical protein
MSTLLSWIDENGVANSCDSRCHNAKAKTCKCLCGGTFHGAASNGTLDAKIQSEGKRVVARAKELAGLAGYRLQPSKKLLQMPLFP